MSKKVKICAALFLAVLCIALCLCCLTACGDDKDERIAELEAENQTLENDISELRQQIDELMSADSDERVAELQERLDKVLNYNDWLRDYMYNGLFAYIRPEYSDVVYDESDFAGIAIEELDIRLNNTCYFITLEEQGIKELIDATLKLYSLDFVDRVVLNYIIEGA